MGKKLNISILYVEDEQTVRESVARSLAFVVKDVHTAENGEVALQYLDKNSVDLIVTDIRMPKLDGLSLVEELRKRELNIPVIITSAFNEIEYLNKAIDLNVDKFIHKPIHLTTLINVVKKLACNIENRRILEERLSELSRYRQVIEKTNFILYASVQKKVLDISDEFSTFIKGLGLDPKEIGSLEEILQVQDIQKIMETILNYKIYSSSVMLRLNGENFSVLLTAFASIVENDRIEEITFLVKDITSVVKEKEELIRHLYTDDLTGLPNRQKLFHDLLQDAIDVGIIIIDIDGFSKINQLYGFKVGDVILQQTTEVLSAFVADTAGSTLYKSDADRFVVLTQNSGVNSSPLLEQEARDIVRRLDEYTFDVSEGAEIDVMFTAGASCQGSDDLYVEAYLALEMAKKNRKSFECFNSFKGMKLLAEKNLKMQNKIKRALKEHKIVNYYQPIVDAQGKLVKYEALVRMEDPDEKGKILTPYDFLDIARASKNYLLLTKRILTTAFGEFAGSGLSFGVNLSFVDIVNPEIVLLLEDLIKEYHNGTVTIELLENEGLIDISETIRFCKNMKALGAKIAIDDFGSGYSNFIYFFDMPIDILKIDGSLVKRVNDYRGYLALETIVAFARNIGVQIVAEFVENEEIFEKLKTLGIDCYQGYYFSKPKPFSELQEF